MRSTNVSRRVTKSVLVGSTAMMLGLAVAGLTGGVAAAQDQAAAAPAGQEVQEVVVTGSRIARRDFTSNSPIVTVNQQAFQNTANVAVEATLNKLPQFTPAQDLTGVNSADVQPTATNTVGISTASLRGLGSNRNVVLADGQRLQPVNGRLDIDLNSIPSAIIDHVEVISGGASAVYGADAVSGVVNFILKKNFQGVDFDTQYGLTQRGDGNQFKASILFGTNFADDKGNVTFGLERFTRAASFQKNHDFYTKMWSDPTTLTNEFFNTGSFFFGPSNPPNAAGIAQVFGAGTPISGFTIFQFNHNGTLAAGTFGNNGPQGGIYNYTGPVDGQHVAYENFVAPSGAIVKGLKTNQVDDFFVTSPLNRWSLYGSAHYDFNENLTAYARGTFVKTHTATNLFPTPFITGWTTNIPYNRTTDDPASPGYIPPSSSAASHPVPANLATLLNNQLFAPASAWTVWLIPTADEGGWMPPRSTVDDNQVWQFTAGLKGAVPYKDWTWELYGSHGEALDYSVGNGYTSLQRFKTIVSAPNYGANQDFFGNQGAPNNGFGVAHVHCTSGFYGAIFNSTKPSKDCIDAITATLQNTTMTAQNIVEFDAQGTLFKLPAGDLKASIGASYRDNSVVYNPDILQSTVSFIDQVAGVYPTAYIDGATSAREGYGELLVPVLADMPFAKHFDLELGGRYSTYTGVDRRTGLHNEPPGGWTYKIMGDWQVNDWMRFRGGYNLAVRSPNAGELFLGKQEVYAAGAATVYGDPCTLRSTAPFGAGGAVPDPGPPPLGGTTYPVVNSGGKAGATSAYNICRALMGTTGSAYYYGGNGLNQVAGAPSAFGFVNQLGNANLNAEKGHTWTAGVVLSSPFHNPYVGNARLSIDWYSIKVTGAIQFQSVDQVKAACYSQAAPDAATAAVVAASAPCQLVARLPGTGQEDVTTIQYNNLSTIWNSGIDFQLDDRWELEDLGLKSVPGSLALNWLFTWLTKYDTQAYAGAPLFHWAGTLGPSLNGVNQGSAYKYKMNTNLTYITGPATVSLAWRFYPHTHPLNYPLYQAQTGGLAACGPAYGGSGPATVNCTLDTDAYHVFDLSATWTIKRNYILRAGIQNLFDTGAPVTGKNTGIAQKADGTYGPGGTLASSGQGTTLPGIYDTLGRQFYVGLNAKF